MNQRKREKYLYRRPPAPAMSGWWWIKIPMGHGAKPHYEPTGVPVDEKAPDRVPQAAIAFRDQKLAEKHRNELHCTNGRVLIEELLDDTVKRWHLESNKLRSIYGMQKVINAHLKPEFGKVRASRLTTSMLLAYREKRALVGRAPATINRELAYLRVALRDGTKTTPPKVRLIPRFPMVEEHNERQGFVEQDQYDKLLVELKPELRPALIIGYHLGLRLQEVLHLSWDWFTRDRSMIFIPMEIEKAERGRGVPVFDGAVKDCIEELWADHDANWPGVPWLLHRNGKRVITLKEAWKQAVARAGAPGLLFHDLRRSAVRNMDKAGIPRRVIMKILGHVTESMFLRYRIVADADLQDAAVKLATYHKKAA